MKKLIYILYFVFIILLFRFTYDSNMFLLTISFSLFLLFKELFSSFSIKDIVSNYYKKKYYYSGNKLLFYSMITILFSSIILIFMSYLISKIINIDHLFIVNIFMVFSVISMVIINILSEYLVIYNYKKIGNNIKNIYYLGSIILDIIIVILLYNVFKFDNYINIIILYSFYIINFIILFLLLYIFIFRKNKYNKKREEVKINYIKDIKKVFITNKVYTLFNLIKSSYIYFSIIILYYILLYKYNYSYDEVSFYISNTYFYGIIIIYFIYIILRKLFNKDFINLKNYINNKDKNIEKEFYYFNNKIINYSLSILILFMIISGPICYLLFNSGINFLFDLVLLLFIYILFNYIFEIIIYSSKSKNIFIILISGLIIKIIFEIPLINCSYRMGYSLVFGSILSNIIGLFVSYIISIIILKKKLNLNLLNNFNNLLSIIYENIILCLILVMFTLIIKINTKSFISSLLVIIFYIFITILYYIIKNKLKKKVQ